MTFEQLIDSYEWFRDHNKTGSMIITNAFNHVKKELEWRFKEEFTMWKLEN